MGKAANAYANAAELGDAWSAITLAKMLSNGEVQPADYAKAKELLERAVALGGESTGAAWASLGTLYSDPGLPLHNVSEAESAFQHAIDNGDTWSAVSLARLLTATNPSVTDFERARTVLQSAIGAGGDVAQAAWSLLAQLYLQDDQPWHDANLAVEAYQNASELGSSDAMVGLARLLMQGTVVPTDIDGARKLLEQAVATGGSATSSAWALLGDLYKNPNSPFTDPAKAVDAYQHAVDNGDKWSAISLARLVSKGEGVPADFDRARALLESVTADTGELGSAAWTNLGQLYANRESSHLDLAKAAAAFEKAAELGEPWAMISLASLYTSGEGVPTSYTKAAELLQKATSVGQRESAASAWEMLGDLYRNPSAPQIDLTKAADPTKTLPTRTASVQWSNSRKWWWRALEFRSIARVQSRCC